MARFAWVDRERKFLLFWSPKVACTTLANWFFFNHLAPPARNDPAVRQHIRDWLAENGYLVPWSRAEPLARREGYVSYMLVRNPAERTLSGFVNKFVHSGDDWRDSAAGLPTEAARIYRRMRRWPWQDRWRYRGISFRELVDYLEAAVPLGQPGDRPGRGRKVPALDFHWDTQIAPQLAASNFVFDHLYPMHHVQRLIDTIAANHGTSPARQLRLNATRYAAEPSGTDLSDVPSGVLARARRPLAPGDFLNDVLRARLERIFADDHRYWLRAQARVAAPDPAPASAAADLRASFQPG